MAVTRGNVNPAMVFEFLYQKIRIFKAYFKRDFDEDTLRNNMTLILELMDGESVRWGGVGWGGSFILYTTRSFFPLGQRFLSQPSTCLRLDAI